MAQIKLLLIGVIFIGFIIIGLGVYLALKPSIQAENNTVISTPKSSKLIEVPMYRAWTTTDVEITTGQTLSINASGRGVWKNISPSNPNATPNAFEECSPDGTSPNSSDYHSNIQMYQTSSANKGALIGKIGSNGVPFKVGSSFTKKITESGALYLGVNDMKPELDRNAWTDNSGGFQARIEIK